MSFDSLGLSPVIKHNLYGLGYRVPTPVQAKAIPLALEGRDVVGNAQTGTGKTAAFGIPMIERLLLNAAAPKPKVPQALVLTPTRELALQVNESLTQFGRNTGLRSVAIFGGVGMQPQVDALKR